MAEKAEKTEKAVSRPKRGFLGIFQRKSTKYDAESRKKAFTKWMNMKLARREPPCEVKDLIQDIQDGEVLFDLLEVLLGHELAKAREDVQGPQQIIHKVLHVLELNGFDTPENATVEIMEGNETVILDLIWDIILRFQIEDTMKEVATEVASKNYTIEKKIRKWCNGRIKSYKKIGKVKDFSLSWKDGLAFNALLYSYEPEMFDFTSLLTQSSEERLNHAFSVATEKFSVPPILETSDLDVEKPDKNLIMMYVCILYEYLERSTAKKKPVPEEHEQKEDEVKPDIGEKLSPAERAQAVQELISKKLKELEDKISQAEGEKPVYNEQESLESLDYSKKELDKFQESLQGLERLVSQTDDVIKDGRHMIKKGYLEKEEEQKELGEKMDKIEHRMKQLHKETEQNRDQLSNTYVSLLRKKIDHIVQWVEKGEEKIKNNKESSKYEEVKKQLEDHQKFQDERGDVSFVSGILDQADKPDPNLSQQIYDDLHSIHQLWKKVWDWCEESKNKLTVILEHWQEFREDGEAILQWLEEKLSMFNEVSQVDVADDEKVNEQLERLEETQKELDEQDLRLKKLEECREKLIEKVGEGSGAAKKIRDELDAYSSCWDKAGKKVLQKKEWLITSRKKVKEFQESVDYVNEWIDGAEREMNDFKEDMSEEEKQMLQDKVEIKREERPATEKKVDGINRLGADLCQTVRDPSPKAIREVVNKLNERWQSVTATLESFSDKGYIDKESECLLLRMFKRC